MHVAPFNIMTLFNEFFKGIVKENPTFRLVLGICPTLAVTTSLDNGLGMGVATTFVLVFSNMFISIVRNIVPKKVRIPIFIVIISTFVTTVELIMAAYVPDIHEALGIFIPLIVVNCIIMGRAEAFASKAQVLPAVADGLGMGIGFTMAVSIISGVREIIGSGTILGYEIMFSGYSPAVIMILPPGAFITMGLILCFFKYMGNLLGRKV
ncbi:MAG: electron transport complex subunit E [Candidatus Magnetoovum sp. WYHC-5]|nr:electron transport complex subunit E [Candidatus Magnetoovum sp. WYHC-5]